jgi:O-antigen/teichoic acid export membrane protein
MTTSTLKLITFILLVLSLGCIFAGYLLELNYSEKLIGFGVVGLFIFVFPLFSYYRWKDRNVKDYMITKESLEKMRDYKEQKDS